jgi:hypothetical protein
MRSIRMGFVAVAMTLGGLVIATARAQAPERPNNVDGPALEFFTDLAADEESAVTDSPGIGHAEFVLDRKTLRLTWKITYSGLTAAPTSISLHGPQTPGGNAGVLLDLAPKGMKSPLEGAAIINDGQLEYLLTGRIYINLFTTKYKEGELRGQIKRRRPEQTKPRS